jgi:hypothetical protein
LERGSKKTVVTTVGNLQQLFSLHLSGVVSRATFPFSFLDSGLLGARARKNGGGGLNFNPTM